MLAIARYALQGPIYAATVVGIIALLSLFIPLLSILSGAIVSLIILTQGLISGTRVILVAIVGITVVSYLVTQSWLLGVSIGLVQWLPLMILAEVLRRTRSISFMLVIGMVLAMIMAALQFVLWPDVEDSWMRFLQLMLGDLQQQPNIDVEQLQAGLQNLVHWMAIILMAVMYSTFVGTLLAGRWFQAKLAESKGFRQEFYAIRLGQGAAAATLVVSIVSALVQSDWLLAVAMVMLATFLFQGLAIAHSWSKHYSKTSWLVLMYMLMVIFPQALAGVAMLGVIDNWMDFRAKFKSVPVNTDD